MNQVVVGLKSRSDGILAVVVALPLAALVVVWVLAVLFSGYGSWCLFGTRGKAKVWFSMHCHWPHSLAISMTALPKLYWDVGVAASPWWPLGACWAAAHSP